MPRSLFLVAIPALALAACAPVSPNDGPIKRADTGGRCAFSETVQGYTVEDDTLYLRAGNRVYQVEAANFCPDLDSGISLGFRPQRGSSQICVGDWIDVIPSGASLASGVCRARVEKFLSPEDVAALPEKQRPR